jgi:PPOX class probable F420-dependent enzyme
MTMIIDLHSEFGRRAERRLHEERIAWLITVDPQGCPQPTPVWFYWDGEKAVIYSRPGKAKLRNLANNPNTALHLDGDGLGGDIIVLTGKAVVDSSLPAANKHAAYCEKYTPGFARIEMTAAQFAATYSVGIYFTPENIRGH